MDPASSESTDMSSFQQHLKPPPSCAQQAPTTGSPEGVARAAVVITPNPQEESDRQLAMALSEQDCAALLGNTSEYVDPEFSMADLESMLRPVLKVVWPEVYPFNKRGDDDDDEKKPAFKENLGNSHDEKIPPPTAPATGLFPEITAQPPTTPDDVNVEKLPPAAVASLELLSSSTLKREMEGVDNNDDDQKIPPATVPATDPTPKITTPAPHSPDDMNVEELSPAAASLDLFTSTPHSTMDENGDNLPPVPMSPDEIRSALLQFGILPFLKLLYENLPDYSLESLWVFAGAEQDRFTQWTNWQLWDSPQRSFCLRVVCEFIVVHGGDVFCQYVENAELCGEHAHDVVLGMAENVMESADEEEEEEDSKMPALALNTQGNADAGLERPSAESTNQFPLPQPKAKPPPCDPQAGNMPEGVARAAVTIPPNPHEEADRQLALLLQQQEQGAFFQFARDDDDDVFNLDEQEFKFRPVLQAVWPEVYPSKGNGINDRQEKKPPPLQEEMRNERVVDDKKKPPPNAPDLRPPELHSASSANVGVEKRTPAVASALDPSDNTIQSDSSTMDFGGDDNFPIVTTSLFKTGVLPFLKLMHDHSEDFYCIEDLSLFVDPCPDEDWFTRWTDWELWDSPQRTLRFRAVCRFIDIHGEDDFIVYMAGAQARGEDPNEIFSGIANSVMECKGAKTADDHDAEGGSKMLALIAGSQNGDMAQNKNETQKTEIFAPDGDGGLGAALDCKQPSVEEPLSFEDTDQGKHDRRENNGCGVGATLDRQQLGDNKEDPQSLGALCKDQCARHEGTTPAMKQPGGWKEQEAQSSGKKRKAKACDDL